MIPVLQIPLSSLIPGMLALAGIVYTQHRANKRTEDEKVTEQFRWTREMRKDSYLALMDECRRLSVWMAMHGRVGYAGKDNEYAPPSPDWMKSANNLLMEVEMFASEQVAHAARLLVRSTAGLQGAAVGHMMQFEDDFESFRRVAQGDLGLAVTKLRHPWMEEAEGVPVGD